MFSLVYMLLISVASPFKLVIDDVVAKACNFALVSCFFFCVMLKLTVLTDTVSDVLTGAMKENYAFDFTVVSVCMGAALASALVITGIMAIREFANAARAPVLKLTSTAAPPLLDVSKGILWHLFLSQCALP